MLEVLEINLIIILATIFSLYGAQVNALTFETLNQAKMAIRLPTHGFVNHPITINSSSANNLSINFGDGIITSLAEQTRHVYRKPDSYNISIYGDNSTISAFGHIHIVNSNLRLFFASPRILTFNENVASLFKARAIIETGLEDEITVFWTFDDNQSLKTKPRISTNGSLITHRYSRPGSYTVSATAYFNKHQLFLNADTKQEIQVVHPISNLTIETDRYSASWENGKSAYNFSISMAQGSHVYLWIVTDLSNGISDKLGPIMNGFDELFVQHIFNEVGVYNVTIVAENALGSTTSSLDESFFVQMPPKNLTLSQQSLTVTSTGSLARISSFIADGTNVSYDWDLGNGDLLSNAGKEVDVVYGYPARYMINVLAYNMVGNEAASTFIYVQDVLQSVNLVLNENTTIALGTSVELTANTLPSNLSVQRYIWNISDELKHLSYINSFTYTPTQSGCFNLTVVAQNQLGFVESTVLFVKVIENISNVEGIILYGEPVVGKEVNITVRHLLGSDITYRWCFGDEEPCQIIKDPYIIKVFPIQDVYNVNVYMSNQFSCKSASKLVFIHHEPCYEPDVRILKASQNLMVYISDDVEIKSSVFINCSLSTKLSYEWKVERLDGKITKTIDSFNQRHLIVVAYDLPIGEYNITLHVRIIDTVVYSSVSTTFEILPDPLSIQLNKYSTFKEDITSKDHVHVDVKITGGHPSAYTRVDWRCFNLNMQPCFDVHSLQQVAFNNRYLAFPARLLRTYRTNYFFFQFTAWQPRQKNVKYVSAFKVFQLHPERAKNRNFIVCKNCFNQKVNFGAKVVYKLLGKIRSDTTWRLYSVQNTDDTAKGYGDGCKLEDFHMYFYNRSSHEFGNNSNEEYSCVSSADAQSICDENFPDIVALPPIPVLFQVHDNFTDKPSHDLQHRELSVDENIAVVVKSSSEPYTRNISSIWELQSNGFENFNSDFISNFANERRKSFKPPNGVHGEIIEADPGRRVQYESFLEIRNKFDQFENSKEELDPSQTSRIETDVFVYNRPNLELASSDDQLGVSLDSRHLIIPYGILQHGNTYLLRAFSGDEVLAEDVIRMRSGPQDGLCFISPTAGIEFSTIFKMHCDGWSSSDTLSNLTYSIEITYNDSPNPLLMYFGFNNSANFRLTSQYEPVSVAIYVGDSLGSKTKACETLINVIPSNGTSLLHVKPNDELSLSEKAPFLMSAKLCSIKLLQGSKSGIYSENELRNISNMIMRDLLVASSSCKMSAYEILSVLDIISSASNFTDITSCLPVERIMKHAIEALTRPYPQYRSRFIARSIEIALNILRKCSTLIHHHFSNANFIFSSIFKMAWQDLTVGEPDQEFNYDPYFTLLTGNIYDRSVSNKRLNVGQTKLSVSMDTMRKCVIFSATDYEPHHYNSELFASDNSMRFKASLQFFTCQLKNMSTKTNINVTFNTSSLKLLKQRQFALHRNKVNVHTFEIYTKYDQTMSVVINLQYISKSRRHRPLIVYIRSVNSKQLVRELPVTMVSSSTQVNLFLTGGHYAIELHDKYWSFNNDSSILSYYLSMYSVMCQSSSDNHHAWITDGSSSIKNSIFESVTCSYSSLGTKSSFFREIFFDYENIPTMSYFGPPVNYTGIVFICCVIFIQIVIACLFKKWRSDHKSSLINIKDNLLSSEYFYLVEITTGTHWNAGTTSKVYIVLYGTSGISTTNEFYSSRNEFFFRGSAKTFLLA